jgi:hypothetical protein
LVQTRTIRPSRIPIDAQAAGVLPEDRRAATEIAAGEGYGDFPDLLGSITDRPDLEQLFARNVGLDSILKLMGRHVSRERILELLASPNFEEDLRKLLK